MPVSAKMRAISFTLACEALNILARRRALVLQRVGVNALPALGTPVRVSRWRP
jgi:hypothetical protein